MECNQESFGVLGDGEANQLFNSLGYTCVISPLAIYGQGFGICTNLALCGAAFNWCSTARTTADCDQSTTTTATAGYQRLCPCKKLGIFILTFKTLQWE